MGDKETWGYGYSLRGNAGPYLERTRQYCMGKVNPNLTEDFKANVTGCILYNFTELDKAMFASRQYLLTLWPAFVGAIVSLSPNPSAIVYDNVWWSALFTLTSGGLPGTETTLPPHHVEAPSERSGHAMCEEWQFDPLMPKAMSKRESMGSSSRGTGYACLEWTFFFISFVLWLWFCVYFGLTLKPALDFTDAKYHLPGTLWYYISVGPALFGLLFELLRNRIDLYEPTGGAGVELETSLTKDGQEHPTSIAHFRHIRFRSVFGLWLRIIQHQWQRSPYRILVRNHRARKADWVFVCGRGFVAMCRVAILTIGSITMGNIVLMPVPNDLYLFILLLFTTALPRQFWPVFWTNGSRGADLVVWVSTVKMATWVGVVWRLLLNTSYVRTDIMKLFRPRTRLN